MVLKHQIPFYVFPSPCSTVEIVVFLCHCDTNTSSWASLCPVHGSIVSHQPPVRMRDFLHNLVGRGLSLMIALSMIPCWGRDDCSLDLAVSFIVPQRSKAWALSQVDFTTWYISNWHLRLCTRGSFASLLYLILYVHQSIINLRKKLGQYHFQKTFLSCLSCRYSSNEP